MGFTIREIDAECKFGQSLTVAALDRALPQRAIHAALAHHGLAAERERKLTVGLTVWVIIALHLYPTVSIAGVLRKLTRGLRFIWPDPTLPLPGDSVKLPLPLLSITSVPALVVSTKTIRVFPARAGTLSTCTSNSRCSALALYFALPVACGKARLPWRAIVTPPPSLLRA